MRKDILHAINEVDDKYIEEAAQCIERNRKSIFYKYRYVLRTAAIVAFIIGLNITNPVLARNIPFVRSVFEYMQTKLDFFGPYDKYSTNVETTAKSNGVTAKLQEVYCDGENLFVSYQIESEKAFSDYISEQYLKTQLDFEGAVCVLAEKEALSIDDFGVSGLEGEFVDEHTFVGVDTIRLVDGKFPDEFTFEMQTYKWKLLLTDGAEQSIKGNWTLSAPVKVNKKDINTINVNVAEKEHSIDKVTVSPIMVTIDTSYPEIYNDNINYDVVVFSNKSEDCVRFQASYKNTEGKTWIPRNMIGDQLDIYVVDVSTFTLTGKAAYAKEEIEKHAIVSTHVDLE